MTRFVLTAMVAAMAVSPAPAQNPVLFRTSYWGDVITAYGEYLNARKEAELKRENVLREKLETRKQELLHVEWETEFRIKQYEWEFQRKKDLLSLYAQNAPINEILTGRALNLLLDEIYEKQDRFPVRSSRPIEPSHLASLNLTGAKPGMGHFGVMNNGRLQWPIYLRNAHYKPQRDKIETLLNKVMTDVQNEGDNNNWEKLETAVRELSGRIQAESKTRMGDPAFSFDYWYGGKHYLKQLDAAVTLLRHENPTSFMYKPQGKTVSDLVRYMKGGAFRFAPAMGGAESAYVGVYQQMQQEAAEIRSKEPPRVRILMK